MQLQPRHQEEINLRQGSYRAAADKNRNQILDSRQNKATKAKHDNKKLADLVQKAVHANWQQGVRSPSFAQLDRIITESSSFATPAAAKKPSSLLAHAQAQPNNSPQVINEVAHQLTQRAESLNAK